MDVRRRLRQTRGDMLKLLKLQKIGIERWLNGDLMVSPMIIVISMGI